MSQVISIDLETELFSPGNMAPPPVCLSWAILEENLNGLVVGRDEISKWCEALFTKALEADGDIVITGFSISYDFCVLLEHCPELEDLIFDLYDAGIVRCAKVREKLLDIAEGTHGGERGPDDETIKKQYDLADIVLRRFGKKLDKETWRTNYGELADVPVESWPQGAIDYAVDDAVWTLKLYVHQEDRAIEMRYRLPDQTQQTRADYSLRLMSTWGLRTDGESVEALDRATQARMLELKAELQEAGLVRRKRKAKRGDRLVGKESKNTAAIREMIEASYSGATLPRTKTGKIKTDADTLELCDDPIAEVLHEYVGLEKSAGAFIDKLREGIYHPIHPFFNILVNSGRTSCSRPNIQQQPRVPGVRECFIPAPPWAGEDWVFLACDYDSQELRTWAQACLDLVGYSTLAKKYQADPKFDPHLDFAAKMLGVDYLRAQVLKKEGDERTKDFRQRAKPANFGFPVGMGAKKFRKYARGYNLILSEDEAKTLRSDWYEQWPESADYFKEINRIVGNAGYGTVIQLRSQRRRGLCRYTVAANTFFQGLAADASKLALWLVTRACYHDKSSPLYGCRPVIFAHDEIIMVAPLSYAHEAGIELRRIMLEAMAVYTPDVPVEASPCIMRRWRKDAEPAYDANGRLIPYEDAKGIAA